MLKELLIKAILADDKDSTEVIFSLSFLLALGLTLVFCMAYWRAWIGFELFWGCAGILVIGTGILWIAIMSLKTILASILKSVFNIS